MLKVEESKIKDNTAIIGGGGISNGAARIFADDVDGGTVELKKAEITDNETLGFGGGYLDIEGNTTRRDQVRLEHRGARWRRYRRGETAS